MATISGLGFSGVDHLNTLFDLGSQLPTQFYYQQKSNKKTLERAAALQYAYAQKYAQNTPSWHVEGLRRANLNPILAATDGAFSSPTIPNVSGDMGNFNTSSNSSSSVGDIVGIVNGIKQGKLIDAKIASEQAQAAKLVADTDKVRVDTDNAYHTKGLSGASGAAASVLTHGADFLMKHTPNSSSPTRQLKSDVSNSPSSVKSKSVPVSSSSSNSTSSQQLIELVLPHHKAIRHTSDVLQRLAEEYYQHKNRRNYLLHGPKHSSKTSLTTFR